MSTKISGTSSDNEQNILTLYESKHKQKPYASQQLNKWTGREGRKNKMERMNNNAVIYGQEPINWFSIQISVHLFIMCCDCSGQAIGRKPLRLRSHVISRAVTTYFDCFYCQFEWILLTNTRRIKKFEHIHPSIHPLTYSLILLGWALTFVQFCACIHRRQPTNTKILLS